MTGRGPERVTPHNGTETRSIHLRVAAVGNISNGGNSELAIPRVRRRPSGCKALFERMRKDGTLRISLG